MKLSDNLSLQEVTKSATAKRLGISNDPNAEHLENLRLTALNIFQPCREHFGKPIAVTSGYRSKALNTAIHGSLSSQHCKGQALDLDAQVYGGLTNKELFNYIKDNVDFDQLIWEFGNDSEPDWVHVSYNGAMNRAEILKAKRNSKGKVFYERYEG